MKLLIPVLLIALAGCAGNTPKTTSYLLRSQTGSGAEHSDGAAMVGISTLTIAPYIDRLGLVLEATDGQVTTARHHVWAEPLRDSLRQYLGEAISDRSGIEIAWQSTAVLSVSTGPRGPPVSRGPDRGRLAGARSLVPGYGGASLPFHGTHL